MRDQYRYILVDEFQDTNIAQLELLWLLAGDRRNILAVGDDDQAIYRFRGASFGSFTIFLERFCGVARRRTAGALARREKAVPVSLSQNYRSTRRILRVAGEMISHNEKSPLLPPKNLTTEIPRAKKSASSNSPHLRKRRTGWRPKSSGCMRRARRGELRGALPQAFAPRAYCWTRCGAAEFPS